MAERQGVPGLPEGIGSNPEFQSSLVRLAVWLFGASYITLAALTDYYAVDVPYFLSLLALFTLLYVAIFISVLRRPAWPARRYVALSLDIIAISLAIFITREAISPFYLLYIWIFISAGTRYGSRHLVVASVEAVMAYGLVLIILGQWRQYSFEAVFFLLLLVLLPLYQYTLLRRVQRAKDEAERANAAKGDFLAFMTHELRTPLTGVIGMAELLKTTALDAEQRDYVQAISNSARVLNALIGDVLDFSKIDAAKLKLEHAPFAPRALVREVCGVLDGLALADGVELVCQVAADVPDTLIGDPLRVRQILFNLVGNAVKFTEEGEVRVGVSLRPAEAGLTQPHLLLEVEDTGIGIPADKLGHIFESFTQADDSTTRRYGGSGLGTTIARELSRLMGGTIGVDSVEGQGSRFWVRLPLQGCGRARVPDRPARLQGLRGLVLEPNQTHRELVCEVLGRTGVTCWGLADADGIPALGLQAGQVNFLIIADQPRGTDLEAVRTQVKALLGGDSPCLFLTYAARRSEGPRADAPCLGKPFIDEDLVRAVEGLLGIAPGVPGRSGAETSGFAGATPATGAGIRVLVAEDNDIAAKVMTAFLSKMGIACTRVENGEQALDEALRGGYSIAFVDLWMPRLDGIAFTRRYRQAAPDRPLPIVALTANASEEMKQGCLAAGMDAFLAKPLSPELLRQTIERLAVRDGQG
jgi:two-component system sensor histidine kinase RpfC